LSSMAVDPTIYAVSDSVVSVKNYCSVCGVFKGGVFLKRPQVAVTNCEKKYANDLADEG
jgi:hypothetical protein